MTTPPAFTAPQSPLLAEFLSKEIAQKTHHITPTYRHIAGNMMLRVTLPPLMLWAVLYACVEYFM